MTISVRRMRQSDGPDLEDIYRSEAAVFQTGQQPGRDGAFWLGFYTSRDANSVNVVAEVEGKVVGHLGVLTNSNPRRKHAASIGIVVHEDFQGRGVGKALMEEALHVADNWLNITRLELTVFSDNARAIALYEKFGFEREGLLRCDVFRNGAYVDGVPMARIRPGT